jgi:tetrahydromethanopterin S-methyltransferase subunit G
MGATVKNRLSQFWTSLPGVLLRVVLVSFVLVVAAGVLEDLSRIDVGVWHLIVVAAIILLRDTFARAPTSASSATPDAASISTPRIGSQVGLLIVAVLIGAGIAGDSFASVEQKLSEVSNSVEYSGVGSEVEDVARDLREVSSKLDDIERKVDDVESTVSIFCR